MSFWNEKDTKQLFQQLPICNASIENQKLNNYQT